jgi:hypothetical protein
MADAIRLDALRNAALPRAAAEVIGDLADLIQKELQLAKAELTEKLTVKLRAGVWICVAGGAALIAVSLVVEGLVFALAAFGIGLLWACLIVAAAFALIAACAYAKASSGVHEDMSPARTIHQVQEDMATAKEQLK